MKSAIEQMCYGLRGTYESAACEECESYYKEGFRFGVLLGLDIAEEQ